MTTSGTFQLHLYRDGRFDCQHKASRISRKEVYDSGFNADARERGDKDEINDNSAFGAPVKVRVS